MLNLQYRNEGKILKKNRIDAKINEIDLKEFTFKWKSKTRD